MQSILYRSMKIRPLTQLIFILLLSSIFSISCTQSPPSILGFQVISLWNLNDETFVPTHILLEIEISNPPTVEDIREIIVRNPASQLSWQVSIGDLHYDQHRGRSTLVLPPLGFEPLGFDVIRSIPFGFYELEVVNLDGQLDRITFSFPRSMVQELTELNDSMIDRFGGQPDLRQIQTEFGSIIIYEVNDQFLVYRFF